jgi:hypothetical protein
MSELNESSEGEYLTDVEESREVYRDSSWVCVSCRRGRHERCESCTKCKCKCNSDD